MYKLTVDDILNCSLAGAKLRKIHQLVNWISEAVGTDVLMPLLYRTNLGPLGAVLGGLRVDIFCLIDYSYDKRIIDLPDITLAVPCITWKVGNIVERYKGFRPLFDTKQAVDLNHYLVDVAREANRLGIIHTDTL